MAGRRRDPLENAIEDTLAPGTFIDYRHSWEFVEEVEAVREKIASFLKSGEAARAVALLEILIAGCYEKSEEIDDSSGRSMIFEQTIEKLSKLKLRGMTSALEQWKAMGMKDLSALDLLGLLVDAECTSRENSRLSQRLRDAHFPVQATVEAIDYQHSRGLSKQKMHELSSSRWVHAHQNVIVTGKTGLGKTYLPCAFGNKACRDGYRVLYTRAPRLFGTLYQARADGTYPRVLQRLAKTHVLIIDDLGTAPLEAQERRDLREVLEDRYGVTSTVITSQLDPKHWHSFIGDETLADAICDRSSTTPT